MEKQTAGKFGRRMFLGMAAGAALLPRGHGPSVGQAGAVIPQVAAIQEYQDVLTAFELSGPHGPCNDILLHIMAPRSLEERLLKAKLYGAAVDVDRFWTLIRMVQTERYFDDRAYAHRIHTELRTVCRMAWKGAAMDKKNHEQFLAYVRSYIAENPEVAPYVSEATSLGMQDVVDKALEQAKGDAPEDGRA